MASNAETNTNDDVIDYSEISKLWCVDDGVCDKDDNELNEYIDKEVYKLYECITKSNYDENVFLLTLSNFTYLHEHVILKLKGGKASLSAKSMHNIFEFIIAISKIMFNLCNLKITNYDHIYYGLLSIYEFYLQDLVEATNYNHEAKSICFFMFCFIHVSYLTWKFNKTDKRKCKDEDEMLKKSIENVATNIVIGAMYMPSTNDLMAKTLIFKFSLFALRKENRNNYFKIFYDQLLCALQTRSEDEIRYICKIYSDVLLNMCIPRRRDRLVYIEFDLPHDLCTLLCTINDETCLLLYNQIAFLLQKYTFDQIYNPLIENEVQIEKISPLIRNNMIQSIQQSIRDLCDDCLTLENATNVLWATVETFKGIVLCYEKKFDFALKSLNSSIQRLPVSTFAVSSLPARGLKHLNLRVNQKVKALIDIINMRLSQTKKEIDMSYIPQELLNREKNRSRSRHASDRSECSSLNDDGKKKKRSGKYKLYTPRKDDVPPQQPPAPPPPPQQKITPKSLPLPTPLITLNAVNPVVMKTSSILPDSKKQSWEINAHCENCDQKLSAPFNCPIHGKLDKHNDLIFYASFTDTGTKRNRELIRKYPNTHNNYITCKKAAKCFKGCNYCHNELERLIWNHMVKKKFKNLIELIDVPREEIKKETKMSIELIQPKNPATTASLAAANEMPDKKFQFKKLFSNYCRLCNIPFENKNAYLQHRLQKSHLELQKAVRQFQFLARMPPDVCKLKKEAIKLCPLMETQSCVYMTRPHHENLCEYPHHKMEVIDWTKWYTYYNQVKQQNQEETSNQSPISEHLLVNDMPKLKQALSYYINEKYQQRPRHIVQSMGLNELTYDALMHGMIHNEMTCCVELVEKTSWNCSITVHDRDKSLFKISLVAKLSLNEHRFYKDLRLIEYINIVRLDLQPPIDLCIHEKFFSDSLTNEIHEIFVIVKGDESTLMSLRDDVTCTLIIDRSMFYAMHYAVDNANKCFLFPPRIDCTNTNIEEALNNDYRFNADITAEQKQIVLRILKEKSGILVPPMIVYGAFGSGKTYCLAEAVRNLAAKRNKKIKILICTSSESAAEIYFTMWDEKTRSKALKLVRCGGRNTVNTNHQVECVTPLTRDVVNKISEATIVVCTLYTSVLLNEDPRIAEWFTHILIDEAAQVLECETIMPLTLALSNTTVVLAGDHRQISPIIYSRENYTFFGSTPSLLQRLFAYYSAIEQQYSKVVDIKDFKLMLTTIHRTVGQLVDFISNNFYNATLTTRRKAVHIADKSIKYYPIQFVDEEMCSNEDYDAKYCSYMNTTEATAICWYLEMLIKNWPIEWDKISIGVVSSELAQVELLRKQCSQDSFLSQYFNIKQIKVDLVQNFQGWQFRVVLISTVRTVKLSPNSNENLLYSLLVNPYSINTCLTRSEELLVVFGQREFLSTVPDLYQPYRMSCMWQNLISLCIHNESYYKISDCLSKREDVFYFEKLKNYLNRIYHDRKTTKKSTTNVDFASNTNADASSSFEYRYKQHINDSILNSIAIDKSQYEVDMNNNEVTTTNGDLPLSRRQNREMLEAIPYKREQVDNVVVRERRRKLYTARDAIDSEDDDANIQDDDIAVEELETYMCMADDDDSDEASANKTLEFLRNRKPYYNTKSKEEADVLLQQAPSRYKLCKIRFENNSYSATAQNMNENEVYYIRDRCNCGMAYNGDTVVCEILDSVEIKKSRFNAQQLRARVICVWQRNEKFRNREFVCLPDEYEPCLMLKPLDVTYPKIFIFGTCESRLNNKITVYRVNDENQIMTSKYHAIDLHDIESNMYKVRVVNWNGFYKYPIGIVTEVLNCANNSENGIRCLKLQYDIDDSDVPDDLFVTAKCNSEQRDQVDLTDILTFTIDPVNSKDFDDALSIQTIKHANETYYKIGIHIADVNSYVKKGDPIDKEAEKRATSYYYNSRDQAMHIPMLPRVLATQYCSLQPNEKRACLSVLFIMSVDGEVVTLDEVLQTNYQKKFLITKSTIKSKYRFSYEDVEFYLNDMKTHEISSELRVLHELSKQLKKKRFKDGRFYIEENSFDTLDFNEQLVARDAHSLIEEFMIFTNYVIADYLCDKYEHVPLRVQKTPNLDSIMDWYERHKSLQSLSFGVERYVTCLKSSVDISDEPLAATKEPVAAINVIKPIFDKIKEICGLLAQSSTTRREILMKKLKYLICNEYNYPLLATAIHEIREIMDPAEYRCVNKRENSRHFSVNLANYTHFTSPIRRYVDLIVHRMVIAALESENSHTTPYDKAYLQEICHKCSVKAKNQRNFEKKTKMLTIAEFLKTSPIESISFIQGIQERQFTVTYPYFNNLKQKKCSRIPYSLLDPSKQPRLTGLQCANNTVSLDDSGNMEQFYEQVDLEFSKRIYDVETKTDILKLIDDTADKAIIKVSLNSLYMRQFNVELWTNIRSMIRNNTLNDIPTCVNRDMAKCRDANEIKTYVDVSSEVIGHRQDNESVSAKTIKRFNRRFTKQYKRGDVMKMQLTYGLDHGFLIPTIQLISITNSINFCVQHRVDPVKCFSEKAMEPIKKINQRYKEFNDYLKIWLPIVSMEAATTAVLEPEDVAFIRNCKIKWSKEEACHPVTGLYAPVLFGKLELDKTYCDERHLKFAEETENELVSKMRQLPRGHPSFPLSYLCVQYKDIPVKASQKRLFEVRTGNLLMKNTYTWVSHCVVTKFIDEERLAEKKKEKKSQQQQRPYRYIIHLALIQSDTEIPQEILVDNSAECTIELISKQYPDSSMEYALRQLNNPDYVVSSLSTAIILGRKLAPIDQNKILPEAQVNAFIRNSIEVSQGRIQEPNVKQREAIQRAFKNEFSLIQGPPGTGKTVTGIILAHCFAQLNTENSGQEKHRLLYCSPSNKAVDVIGRFLKNRFFQGNNSSPAFSFVRVYSERIASAEYPHPKYFDKILVSSPRLPSSAQTQKSITSSGDDNNNHSDPELIDFVLHHIIRKEDKPFAEILKNYDRKFSVLREFEDRVRNRAICCCGNEIGKFRAYNFRVCKHARYFSHVNKEFSMHHLIRNGSSYNQQLRDYDNKFKMLKFYIKRLTDQNFELSEIEKVIASRIARRDRLIAKEEVLPKARGRKIIQDLLPKFNNIQPDEIEAFLNTIKVEVGSDTLYNLLGYDANVSHARREKSNFDATFEVFRTLPIRELQRNKYYQELGAEYGYELPLEELIFTHSRVLLVALSDAHQNAYVNQMTKLVTQFRWNDIEQFENLVIDAECQLFRQEIDAAASQANSNDSESYTKILHDAYELELNQHDMLLSTCIATSTSVLSKIKNFKQLIIDEAGMTKEPEALVPILLCNPDKVVLIGDHAQLRPIIKCQHARDLGLDQSLFERYCQKVTMLEEQYRMHDSICHFPSKKFYNGQLITKTPNYSTAVYWPGKYLKHSHSSAIDELKREMRVVFIDVKGTESKLAVHSNEGSENSVRNDDEIDCVEQIYKYLAESDNKKNLIEKKDIIVLSQYRAQVRGICSKLKLNDERVLTVITSQGSEWDYVILSTVRSLPDCDIDPKATEGWRKRYLGFISDKNQMNVALTRAKRGLFIIGNRNLLKCDPLWFDLIKFLEDKNSVLTLSEYFSTQKVVQI